MSSVILNQEDSLQILCAGTIYKLCEGEDGSLYIESDNSQTLAVNISDDADEPVHALGAWVNIHLLE